MAVRKVPTPKYDYEVNRIMKVYQNARQEILAELLRLVSADMTDNAVRTSLEASLIRQIDYILQKSNTEIQRTVEELILESFRNGQGGLLYAVGEYESLTHATQGVAFSMLAKQTVDAMVADTFTDLLTATEHTSKRLKRIVRQTVAEQMRIGIIKQSGRRLMSKAITDQLTKQGFSKKIDDDGFVGIIDRKGRKWKLDTYSRMVVRTKLTQAHSEGMKVQGIESNIDLAVISSHGAKDSCAKYEGLVVSMNGLTKGYKTVEELRKSNKIFHPNCEHTFYPIRNLDVLSDKEREIHGRKSKNIKNI
ncbi:minor capsid protein [Bacillus thuringiensis]|uniref:phage minor capsid protein n=1 Tax=Bacillus cereus group TaxID=86661 RepID=UPI000CD823CD|nr:MULTISPECIES: phage minor capsid protein [Bacillus cereus group]MEC3417079.1 minor capsid protein [Bacillus cereus]MEC3596983.1 minor capsid protein [Bacillus thuringiensis]MED1574248.1 minor capsid protein [Bacillus paranthracis]MED1836171.1 minor capsid protein [Bacillus thuringiensis]MED2670234.1 minor capsid protein [Bacillus thuringiensis]